MKSNSITEQTDLFLAQTRLRIKKTPDKLDISGYGVAIPAIAAYERSKGINTKIYDPNLNMDTYDQIIQKIMNVNPLVLGISRITSTYMDELFDFVHDIRVSGYKGFIFLGGHAPSIEYERILTNCKEADCVVIGEGEETIYELVTTVKNKGDWKKIDGIAYCVGHDIKRNRLRPLIQNLDELPFMAADYIEELQETVGKDIVAYLVSSRGCYKNCSFCAIAAYFDMFEGWRMRYRSIENVFSEVKKIYEDYGIRKFCFWDDNFIIPGKKGIERIKKFKDLIKTLPEEISIEIETRVDTISYEAIKILKEAGLKHIHIGLEAFNDRDLKLYNKCVTMEQNDKALSILEDLGFSTKVGSKYRIATYLICFNPYTELNDIIDMIKYFYRYSISPKKQISALYVTNNAPIKNYLIEHGVELRGEDNKWEFIDKRVGDIYKKYSDFVGLAMIKRENLRTIEKLGLLKKEKILDDIVSLRTSIDNKCTECLEILTKTYIETNDAQKVEEIYKRSIQDLNDYVDENSNGQIKELLKKYENIFYQENM